MAGTKAATMEVQAVPYFKSVSESNHLMSLWRRGECHAFPIPLLLPTAPLTVYSKQQTTNNKHNTSSRVALAEGEEKKTTLF